MRTLLCVSMCNLPTPAASECTSAAAETSRLYFFRMSLLICLFSQFGVCILLECPHEFANFYMSDKQENQTSTRLWLKKRGFGSRFSTSTGEVHFDKLRIRISTILFRICGAKVAPEPRHSKIWQGELWPRSCRNKRGDGKLPFNKKTNFDSTWKQRKNIKKPACAHVRACEHVAHRYSRYIASFNPRKPTRMSIREKSYIFDTN